MTIDDLIEKYKIMATKGNIMFPQRPDIAEKSNVQYKQTAEWLEELKFLRQWKSDVMEEFCKYDCNSVEEIRHNAYGKAIDDLLKLFLDSIKTYDIYGYQVDEFGEGNYLVRLDETNEKDYAPYIHLDDVIKCINGVTKQLKGE